MANGDGRGGEGHGDRGEPEVAPPASPNGLLRDWMGQAEGDERILYHTAASLATVDAQGRPDARIILLKDVAEDGFTFYTNLESPKAQALLANPQASLVLYWEPLARQIRVRGGVAPVPPEEADAYFATRPRGSRIGAWASDQSRPLEDREVLEGHLREVERRFGDAEVPRPPHWGGFRLHPEEIEFWLEREYRLHDRFLYRRLPDRGWTVQRLFP